MQVKDRELIAALMTSKKVSARKLAEQAGWKSHTYLQRILRGEITTVTSDRAALIAFHLGVPAELLFVTRVATNPERLVQSDRTKRAS